jgi:hypothetical protein
MRKWFVSAALACGCSIGFVSAATAQVQIVPVQGQPIQIVPVQGQPAIQLQVQAQPLQPQPAFRKVAPGPQMNNVNRLASFDAVFVGRVVAFEPMDVEVGQPKQTYRVAVVQVTETVYGLKKETKMVRVAFNMAANNGGGFGGGFGGGGGGVQIQPAIQIKGRPPIRFPGNFQMQLQVGQDGLFSVNKHEKEDFFLSPTPQNFVSRPENPAFEGQLKTAKELSKVMANPVAALKSDDKQDRYTAAAVLVNKYRMVNNPTGQPMKQEPIDAEESKLILKAIAAGDWTPNRVGGALPAPYELFSQLGIGTDKKDGYAPVNLRTQEEIHAFMQKWLDENNGKYVIQKNVVDPNAKAPEVMPPNGRPIIRPNPIRIQPLPAPQPALPPAKE